MRRIGKFRAALLIGGMSALVGGAALFAPSTAKKAVADSDDLTNFEITTILVHGVDKANVTDSGDGLRSNTVPSRGPIVTRKTRMVVAVVDRDGKLRRWYAQADAWVGSIDIAIAKARTAAFFSSNHNALTSRVIGSLSQPGQPLWGIGNSNQVGISGGPNHRNGIITFPGGVPLYKSGKLAGGVGVSGDGVDQDEAVAFGAALGFAPGPTVVKLGFP